MKTLYTQDFLLYVSIQYNKMNFLRPWVHTIINKFSTEPTLAQAWEQQYIKTFNKSPTIRIINIPQVRRHWDEEAWDCEDQETSV